MIFIPKNAEKSRDAMIKIPPGFGIDNLFKIMK